MSLWSVSGLIFAILGIRPKSIKATETERNTRLSNISRFTSKIGSVGLIEKQQNTHPHEYYYPPFGKNTIKLLEEMVANNKNTLGITAAIALIMSAYLFSSFIKIPALMISFIALGAMSRLWQRYIPIFSFGIELVLLFTVVSGMVFGPFAGLIVGVFSIYFSTFMTREDPIKMWPAFVAIAAVGNLAGSFSLSGISFAGIVFTVLYDVIISVIYISLGASVIKTLIFDATHIAFNYYVFYNLAPLLVSMIT